MSVDDTADPWAGQPVTNTPSVRRESAEAAHRRETVGPLWGESDTCPADLVEWINRGQLIDHDDDGTPIVRTETPRGRGTTCAADAQEHPHRTCWCGKFQYPDT